MKRAALTLIAVLILLPSSEFAQLNCSGGCGVTAPVSLANGGTGTTTAASFATTGGLAQYSDARFEIVSSTKNIADANTDQIFTGCGFAPVALIAYGHLSANSTSWGFIEKNGTVESAQKAAYLNVFDVFTGGTDTTLLFNALVDGSNLNQARVTAWGSDGFTLSWVKTGSPTGTLDETIMCIR